MTRRPDPVDCRAVLALVAAGDPTASIRKNPRTPRAVQAAAATRKEPV